MPNETLDFDDWTAQITKQVNALKDIILIHNKKIEKLEAVVKELKDHKDGI